MTLPSFSTLEGRILYELARHGVNDPVSVSSLHSGILGRASHGAIDRAVAALIADGVLEFEWGQIRVAKWVNREEMREIICDRELEVLR